MPVKPGMWGVEYSFEQIRERAFGDTMKRIDGVVILLVGCLAALGGPAAPSTSAPQGADVSQYVLGPADQLKVWALGVDEIPDKAVIIDPNGDIDLPLIGKVHAEGLTVEQLKSELVQRLSKDLLKPQVTVEIVDYGSQPVSVMGAVTKPGVYQLQGRKSLMEAISLANGLRPDAGPRITISRQIQYGKVPLRNARSDSSGKFSVGDVQVTDLLAGTSPTDNIQVLPNDVITVPMAESVFVVGEVKKPGEVTLKNNSTITVLQALASAEGLGTAPSPQKSKIIRLVPGSTERREIPVDLNKIRDGKAEDIAMRANDILVVPSSGPKKAVSRALEAAIQTATGVAIWRVP